MPVWKVREKGSTPEGRLYLLVDFWFGNDTSGRPDLTNDFVLDVPRHEYPINKRQSDGWWELLDGTFIRPNVAETMPADSFKRTETVVDVRARVNRIVRAYFARAIQRQYSGDHTGDATKPFRVAGQVIPQRLSTVIQRDQTDRRQQLAEIETDVEVRE